jgi:hypothetical protein
MVVVYNCIENCDMNIVLQFLAITVNANSFLFLTRTKIHRLKRQGRMLYGFGG